MTTHACDEIDFSNLISECEWSIYRKMILAAQTAGYRFALGGGLAFSAYASRMRNTKDADLFILPEDRTALIGLAQRLGFEDYYPQEEYDRSWIWRGIQDGVILDLIWTMPNHRMVVDEAWLTRGGEVTVRELRIRLLPVEELLWTKIFVLQYDRCDWPDLLNILLGSGDHLDWAYLIGRMGEDVPLLAGLMSIYTWLCPAKAKGLPSWIWSDLGLPGPDPNTPETNCRDRARLLDTRDWFGPTTEEKPPC